MALQRHLGAEHIADTVVLERSPKGRWSAPQSISEAGPLDYAERPDVGIDGAGNVTVVWQQQGPTYNYATFAAYRPAGGAFGPPVPLSGLLPVVRVLKPRIAVAADGTAVVAWTRQTVAGTQVEATVGRGGVWEPRALLSDPGDNGGGHAVAIGRQGEAVITWTAGSAANPSSRRVKGTVRLGCGGFGAAVDLSQVGATSPRVVGVDGVGNMLAVWRRDEGGVGHVEAARRPAGASGWEPARKILSWPTRSADASEPPALAVSPDGQVLVLAVEPAGRGSVVRARVGSVRSGRFGATEEVVRGPNRSSTALGAVALGIPVTVAEQVLDPLDASYRRGAPVRLTGSQVLITHRIAQEALRRANVIERLLNRGLGPEFVRNSSLEASAFGPSVQLAQDPAVGCVPPTPPAPVLMPAGQGGGRVRLSAAQLLITQRIAQAALRRANAIQTRLDAGLTGGDLRDGAIDQTKLAPGLRLAGRGPAGATAPPTVTRIAPAGAGAAG
jgi:hypothetical protein